MRAETILSYRKPWIMVDLIDSIVEDGTLTARRMISTSDHFMKGHFASYSVYPGVLLIEGLKQIAEYYMIEVLKRSRNLTEKVTARFLNPVFPGDVVHFSVECIAVNGKAVEFTGFGEVGAQTVLKASIVFKGYESSVR